MTAQPSSKLAELLLWQNDFVGMVDVGYIIPPACLLIRSL